MRDAKNTTERRKKLEKLLGINLNNIGSFTLDEKLASTRSCENMIGATQIPIGVAGPLKVTTVHSKETKSFYIPLATTEGALVASVNRGCKAITISGGASVLTQKVGATRGPVFEINGLNQVSKLENFLNKGINKIRLIVKETDSHIHLLGYKGQAVGRYYFIRFNFDTEDAMGMNMVTIATNLVAKYITLKTGIKCISVSGNYCVDKKASWLNFVEGRGSKVNAEVVLNNKVIKEVLKTTPQKMYDVWLAKCMTGSVMSGSIGYNAQFANIVAAFFLATGQDPAHVVEGSLGITTMKLIKNDLFVSIYMPDVMLGTVGGGTYLTTQKEALSIVGTCDIASVLGAVVLAGEVSLIASLSEGTLAKAHQKLGRSK